MLIGTFSTVSFIWIAATAAVAVQTKTGADSASNAFIAFIFLFNAVFAFGITPLQALYPVEVLSFEMRAKGMAFSNLSLTTAMLINQFAYPIALEKIEWKLYIVFIIWCPIQAFVVWMFIPETKNRTLVSFLLRVIDTTTLTVRRRKSMTSSTAPTLVRPRSSRRRWQPMCTATSSRSRRFKSVRRYPYVLGHVLRTQEGTVDMF
jgi:hypothetical protein